MLIAPNRKLKEESVGRIAKKRAVKVVRAYTFNINKVQKKEVAMVKEEVKQEIKEEMEEELKSELEEDGEKTPMILLTFCISWVQVKCTHRHNSGT